MFWGLFKFTSDLCFDHSRTSELSVSVGSIAVCILNVGSHKRWKMKHNLYNDHLCLAYVEMSDFSCRNPERCCTSEHVYFCCNFLYNFFFFFHPHLGSRKISDHSWVIYCSILYLSNLYVHGYNLRSLLVKSVIPLQQRHHDWPHYCQKTKKKKKT